LGAVAQGLHSAGVGVFGAGHASAEITGGRGGSFRGKGLRARFHGSVRF